MQEIFDSPKREVRPQIKAYNQKQPSRHLRNQPNLLHSGTTFGKNLSEDKENRNFLNIQTEESPHLPSDEKARMPKMPKSFPKITSPTFVDTIEIIEPTEQQRR